MTVTVTEREKEGVLRRLGFCDWATAVQRHELFRHKKGGIYRLVHRGRHADDGSRVVIYQHLWPHQVGLWVRNEAEFFEEGRFVRIAA